MPVDDSETYAPLATVERYHAEDGAYREKHAIEHDALKGRIVILETTDAKVEMRLTQGVQTFVEMKNDLAALTKKIMLPVWKIGLIALALLTGVATVVWKASSFTDRSELDKTNGQIEVVRKQAEDLRLQGALLQQMNSELKTAVDSLSGKVDTLIRRP